jgi:hypothetical protein
MKKLGYYSAMSLDADDLTTWQTGILSNERLAAEILCPDFLKTVE